MIKAIIFDVGGVLLRTVDRSYRQQWEEKLGLKQGELEAIVLNSEQGKLAQHGVMTEDAHWHWVGQHFSLNEKMLAQLRHDFWAGDEIDRPLIDYIHQLRGQYTTAIISNAMTGLRPALTDPYRIREAFDLVVVSGEEGIMKPNAGIYQRTLLRLDCEPSAAIFIDDFLHNIEGAQAVGMAGIHYQGKVDLPSVLATYGVTI